MFRGIDNTNGIDKEIIEFTVKVNPGRIFIRSRKMQKEEITKNEN